MNELQYQQYIELYIVSSAVSVNSAYICVKKFDMNVVEMLKGKFVFFFLNLDLISGTKYINLLTDNSLVKVSVLQTKNLLIST